MKHSEFSEDQAIDAFNADMSNACDASDREFATKMLAQRIGDKARAVAMRQAWMLQQRQAARDAKA